MGLSISVIAMATAFHAMTAGNSKGHFENARPMSGLSPKQVGTWAMGELGIINHNNKSQRWDVKLSLYTEKSIDTDENQKVQAQADVTARGRSTTGAQLHPDPQQPRQASTHLRFRRCFNHTLHAKRPSSEP